MINLVSNALDATPAAGTITVSTRRVGEPASTVVLEVADTGIGIAAEHLSKLFDPFFTTKPPGKGTGLGLSVCLGIVHDHHGTITVASQPGGGSTFLVTLPVTPPMELCDQDCLPMLQPALTTAQAEGA